MARDRRDEDDHAGRTRPPFLRDWSWIPFVLIFLLVASHVLTYEYTAGTPRPSWFDDYDIRVKDTERLMLYAAAILACATAVRMVLYRVGAESVLRRRSTRLGYRVVLLTLLITTGFNFFYVRRASYNHWWHCYDSYHYGLNPKFYDELGYEHLYDCTVEAAPRKKLWHKTEVRNLKTYGFTSAKKVRETRGPGCKERFTPERWEEFDRAIDLFLDKEECGAGRVRAAVGDQGYNGTPFHRSLMQIFWSVAPLERSSFVLLALFDVFALCVAHLFMTRTVGWRRGYTFSIFAFTLATDRFSIIGGSSMRLLWLAAIIIAIAALIRRRWASAGACLSISAMLNVFPLLIGVGALLGLTGAATRDRRRLPDLRRFVVGGLVSASLCLAVTASQGDLVDGYRAFMHDMEVHSEGPPSAKLGGRLEKTPGYGVGLKFAFTYRGEHGKPNRGYSRVRLTQEFAQIEPVYRILGWTLTGVAAVLAFHLAVAEAAVMFGFIAFFALLGTVAYYFAFVALIPVALMFSRHRSTAELMFLLFLLTSIAGLVHLVSPQYTATSLNRTLITFSWLGWIGLWLVWTLRRTGLLPNIHEDAD